MQLIRPKLTVTSDTGLCLWFIQEVFGVPHFYKSAWEAWRATKLKHTDDLPDDAVPVWFSHYGSYGQPASYGNWGHVVTYVPGRGFLSSPPKGHGQTWLSSIKEVEKTYNATYVGWSEDISGRRVASVSKVTLAKATGETTMDVEDVKRHVMRAEDQIENLKQLVVANDDTVITSLKKLDDKIEDLKRHMLELKK